LKQLTYLSNGDVVSKTASDFIGEYIGESQRRTSRILEGAAGKVLVIDEAYALNDNMYGKQVLDTLVEKIQNESNSDIAVLLLGYESQMLEMLRVQNPGLAPRFPKEYAFYFDDYTDEEMLRILVQLCKERSIKCSKQVYEKIIETLSKQRVSPNFGNIGSLKNLMDSVVNKALSRQKDPRVTVIELEDVGEEKAKDPYESLKKMYRIDNILQALKEMENYFKVCKQEMRILRLAILFSAEAPERERLQLLVALERSYMISEFYLLIVW
jgi:chromosomal replication initiation ATPase DnaA